MARRSSSLLHGQLPVTSLIRGYTVGSGEVGRTPGRSRPSRMSPSMTCLLVWALGVLMFFVVPSQSTALPRKYFVRSLQQTNLVNLGVSVRTIAGPLSNETRFVLEAETSAFISSSILDQEEENSQLSNLVVDTELVAQQFVAEGGDAPTAQADGLNEDTDAGTWQLIFAVKVKFRLPEESDTMGMTWITEAFKAADDREAYVERLRSKNDPAFAAVTDVLLVLVDGAVVQPADPVETEFVDIVMLIKPMTKTLRDSSGGLYKSIVSNFIEDYIGQVDARHPERLMDDLYVDTNIVRQRLLLPENLDYDVNVSSLLQNESLALEIVLDIQVDYRSSLSGGLDYLNITSWVFASFASDERQANFTALLRNSNESSFEFVEAVQLREETVPPTQTVEPDAPKVQPAAKDQNRIGIIAGAVMLGVAVIGLVLFGYSHYRYKCADPPLSEPAVSGGKAQKQLHSSNKKQIEPEVILGAYRDLHLGKQEDISTLGDSLGGVTSQRIHKEGSFLRMDL